MFSTRKMKATDTRRRYRRRTVAAKRLLATTARGRSNDQPLNLPPQSQRRRVWSDRRQLPLLLHHPLPRISGGGVTADETVVTIPPSDALFLGKRRLHGSAPQGR
jgi:hypothetical protein